MAAPAVVEQGMCDQWPRGRWAEVACRAGQRFMCGVVAWFAVEEGMCLPWRR